MEATPQQPNESFSKQASAILDSSPGHFESIQCFSQQLDLSILGDQARKEELMNGSSRFAGHRGGFEFPKGLVGSIDQHLDILELETGIEIEHGLEKTGESRHVLGTAREFRTWQDTASQRRHLQQTSPPPSSDL
jgi:hypothetical protein